MNNSGNIAYERDGTKDGSTSHNHRSAHGFGGYSWFTEPYSSQGCWNNETLRDDDDGEFTLGHCYIDESGLESAPEYAFVGTFPSGAKQRVRDASAYGGVTSDSSARITGIAFQETASLSNAQIVIYWEDMGVPGTGDAGQWIAGAPPSIPSEIKFNSHSDWNWDYGVSVSSATGTERHFYSVALHEVGHAVGLAHQNEAADLMTSGTSISLPANNPAHRYFDALDASSIEGVRDLYSQPLEAPQISCVVDTVAPCNYFSAVWTRENGAPVDYVKYWTRPMSGGSWAYWQQAPVPDTCVYWTAPDTEFRCQGFGLGGASAYSYADSECYCDTNCGVPWLRPKPLQFDSWHEPIEPPWETTPRN